MLMWSIWWGRILWWWGLSSRLCLAGTAGRRKRFARVTMAGELAEERTGMTVIGMELCAENSVGTIAAGYISDESNMPSRGATK